MTDETRKPVPRKRAPQRQRRRKQARAAGTTTPNAPLAAQPTAAPRVLATVPIHVRWHDLDAFNHVNNASFLILLEEARLQWLRTVPGEWFTEHAMPVAASIQLNYRKPISWPADGIDVVLTCARLGRTSVTIGNRVVEHGEPTCVYAEGDLVMVWMDPATGRPVPLPEAIRSACG